VSWTRRAEFPLLSWPTNITTLLLNQQHPPPTEEVTAVGSYEKREVAQTGFQSNSWRKSILSQDSIRPRASNTKPARPWAQQPNTKITRNRKPTTAEQGRNNQVRINNQLLGGDGGQLIGFRRLPCVPLLWTATRLLLATTGHHVSLHDNVS
jgi:hypothetical protein